MVPGLIAKKIGMRSKHFADGTWAAVTCLQVLKDSTVIEVKTNEKNGYSAVVVAAGNVPPRKLSKPVLGVYKKLGIAPRKSIKEFRLNAEGYDTLAVGTALDASLLRVGQKVDVCGESIGKGFAGVMKRWNHAGQEATHGVSLSHRVHGSTGQCQDPGKVFKGKKMAGHLGTDKCTSRNLEIVGIVGVGEENDIIEVLGSVPGKPGSQVTIRPAIAGLSHIG